MLVSQDKITEIFFVADEFFVSFKQVLDGHSLGNPPKRPPKMSCSEVITIMTMFHLSGYRNMKHFYLHYIKKHCTHLFPDTVSYTRFTELMQAAALPMAIMLKTCCLGEGTGIAFIDSTPIRVCRNKRIRRNKVFAGLAGQGKSSIGFFYGFKLHIIINDKGELLNFMVTPGNTDDRDPLKEKGFVNQLKGKLYGDKGYISKHLAELLFMDGLHLVTQIRKNMKNQLMSIKDKIMLRKRSLIETVNDELKNMCQVEHSRHRSFGNFISNLLGGLIAYSFLPKKPEIRYEKANTNQLTIF